MPVITSARDLKVIKRDISVQRKAFIMLFFVYTYEQAKHSNIQNNSTNAKHIKALTYLNQSAFDARGATSNTDSAFMDFQSNNQDVCQLSKVSVFFW